MSAATFAFGVIFMSQIHRRHTAAPRNPAHPSWWVGSLMAAAVVLCTTFSQVIRVPIVSNFVGGSIFEISGYVGDLTRLYAPWLSKMMAEHAGSSTATLLHVGSAALIVLEGVAILALICLLLHAYYTIRMSGSARAFGVAGFVLAMLVPVSMFAVVWFVGTQMTSNLIQLNVVEVPTGPRLQLAAAIAGLVCAANGVRKKQGA